MQFVPNRMFQTFPLQVTCTTLNTGKRKTIPLIVTISDINDNTPRFVDLPYVVSLPEVHALGNYFIFLAYLFKQRSHIRAPKRVAVIHIFSLAGYIEEYSPQRPDTVAYSLNFCKKKYTAAIEPFVRPLL